jgi:hypothetical protein
VDAVLIAPAAGWDAGTVGRVGDATDGPRRFTGPDGSTAEVPEAAVAVRTGPALRVDLDGDGLPERAWAAVSGWVDPQEDFPVHASVVVADGLGLGPVHEVPCGDEPYVRLAARDLTGDGVPELLAVRRVYTCEVGWTADALEVLAPAGGALSPLLEVSATVFPGVGAIQAGRVEVARGRVEVATAGELDGDPRPVGIRRETFRWDGAAFVADPAATDPLVVRGPGGRRAVDAVPLGPLVGEPAPRFAGRPGSAAATLSRDLGERPARRRVSVR